MSGSSATIWEGPTVSIPAVNTNGNTYEEVQVATAAQVLFTLATFTYTPNTRTIFVFKNGVMLRRGVDYTETSTTQITLASGAALSDKLTFVAYAIASVNPPVTQNGMPAGGTTGQILTKTSNSDYATSWSTLSALATLLDSARVNIASASTVDLTAIAATTRNIQITGSVQIDGFQITNGQLWVVKFAASLTLKNNASIVTESGQDIKVSPNDTCLLRATAANTVEIVSYTRASSSVPPMWNDHRLTLTSATPVTVADVTGATIVYMTAYKGQSCSLFNGTSWVVRQFTEISIALAALAVGRPYDVFVYDNAGTATLELLSWASDSARTAALSRQDGVLVKATDVTRKYVGTFYTTAANTTEDSDQNRYLWNNYNRVARSMRRKETAASWNYTTATYRQANGSTLNQLNFVVGVAEDVVRANLQVSATNTVGAAAYFGIGYDSVVVPAESQSGFSIGGSAFSNINVYQITPAAGRHFMAWLEYSIATGVTTWNGSGVAGSVLAGQMFS